MLTPIQPPDLHHLNAAEGWLGLGNAFEAEQELQKLSPGVREHPDVLRVSYQLYQQNKNWERAAETAQLLCQVVPGTAFGWIHLAYALHELKKTSQAYQVLLPVIDRFPEEFVIPYNLACYCCQMRQLEEARAWLKKAIALAGPETIKQMALTDPDLATLRAEIQRI